VRAHVEAFSFYNGVVRRIVLDNLRAGVVKPDIYDPKLNRAYAELGAYCGCLLDPARVGHPKDKPRIESVQGYIRRSFYAGRDFASIEQMISEARRWSVEVAGGGPESLGGSHPCRGLLH